MSWKKVRLGDVCDVLGGFAFKSENFKSKGIPLLRISNIVDGEVTFKDDCVCLEDTNLIGLQKFIVQKNDILLALSGATTGKFGVFNLEEVAVLNQRVGLIRATEKMDQKFLLYYFNILKSEIAQIAQGAAQPNISTNEIINLQIPLPPLATQKRIAEILDAADALRRKDQELLNKYDELAQAIFIDMFGDPVKNEKGWDIDKLGESCGVGSSVRVFVEELVDNGVPFLRGQEIGAMSSGEKIKPSLFITTEHFVRLKAQGGVPQVGDLLMPSICPDGRIYQVTNEEPFYFKDGRVLWIKVNEDHYDSTFLKYLLKEKFLRNYTNIASGTTFAELKIFALKDLELIMPPLALQKKFAQFIESTFTQLESSRKSYKATSSLFNSLIQKAFKGELVS